jgi:hypothetical protein
LAGEKIAWKTYGQYLRKKSIVSSKIND